jgi:hypothetical protein
MLSTTPYLLQLGLAPPPAEADIIFVHRRPDPRAPSSPRSGFCEKEIGDGAAIDFTIVRPPAAAPPRRPEPVELIARARPSRA